MLIAGPCGITSKKEALKIATFVKTCGAEAFRGGVFKGQNTPFVNGKPEWQGLGYDGLPILTHIQDKLLLPCVCDVQCQDHVDAVIQAGITYLMVGARNMDNLALLRYINNLLNVYKLPNKIILKRGPAATVKEWIGAAEHLGGPNRVILCERGTVHFDRHDYTRFRLDFVGMAEVKRYHPKYTLLTDPSHGCGNADLVLSLSKAALEIADGLMIETHYKPQNSPTDSPQIINFGEFKKLSEYYNERQTV